MRWFHKIVKLLKREQQYKLMICHDTNVFYYVIRNLFHGKDIRYVRDIMGCRGHSRENYILVYGLPYLPKEKLELIEELSMEGYMFQMIPEKTIR